MTTIAAVCGLLLASWLGWSIAVYGIRTTFASNTSATLSRAYPGRNLAKIAGNLTDSIVPVVLRNHFLLDDFSRQGLAGRIRDDAFIFYQTNAIFGMGLIGGPLILWLLYHFLFRRFRFGPERRFWLAMIPFCVVVGIASTGERDPLGKAQLTLLPLEILGLSLLASLFPLRRALLALVITGCLIDCSFGILLHVGLESLENSSQKTIFPGLSVGGGKQSDPVLTPDSLSAAAWNNWFLKHQYALSAAKLAELWQHHPDAAVPMQIQISLHEDELYWHGWYARHNGSIRFLGDDVAGGSGSGTTVLACLSVLLVFGLMPLMLNYHAAPTAIRAAHVGMPEVVGAGVTENARLNS